MFYVYLDDKMTREIQLHTLIYLLPHNKKMFGSVRIVFRNLQDSIAFKMAKIQ